MYPVDFDSFENSNDANSSVSHSHVINLGLICAPYVSYGLHVCTQFPLKATAACHPHIINKHGATPGFEMRFLLSDPSTLWGKARLKSSIKKSKPPLTDD